MFAQQATEKALKALLFERSGQLPPKTHDLRTLGSLANAPGMIQHDLAILFPVFSLTRYPDNFGVPPVDAVNQADAVTYVDAARRVLQWIQPQL